MSTYKNNFQQMEDDDEDCYEKDNAYESLESIENPFSID